MSIRETSANAATVTAINSGAVGAAGWVNENYQMLMLGIAATSTIAAIILGVLNHLERRRVRVHLENGD